jgi:hypothetical protein
MELPLAKATPAMISAVMIPEIIADAEKQPRRLFSGFPSAYFLGIFSG